MMMKKFLFLVVCFFLMMNRISAVSLECPSIASPFEVITCQIKDEEYIGIKAKYKLADSFNYIGIGSGSLWKKYYASELGFSFGNVSNDDKFKMDVEFEVDKNVLVNQDYVLELVDIEVVDKEYKYIKLDNISSTIKVLSNINTLEDIKVSTGELKPIFDKNVTSYGVVVDSDTIIIDGVATDDFSVISGDIGEKKLEYGVNNFVISVTSARGEIRNYYLYVTRKIKEVKKSSDFTLKSITLSSGELKFDKNKFLYAIDVSYDIEDILIEAIPNSDKAKVDIIKPDSLIVGENYIEIIVTAEDGTVGKYVIVVNRNDKLSSDASIKRVVIDGYDIDFSSDVYKYQLEIANESKLDIEVVLNDNKASYKISGNNKLKNGSIINIQVVAQDGTFKNYQIEIVKLDKSNSDFIINGINPIVLIGLLLVVIVVFVVKTIKKRNLEKV